MAEKDLAEKKLEDYPEIFADIMNVLVIHKDYIQPEKLLDGPTESIYKAEGNMRNQFRDTSKYYRDAEINIASIGIENQAEEDEDMPIRIMGYDYGQYRHQIDLGKERYPSITIVLNFSEKKWNKPKHLKALFRIPKELESVVQDYEIQVYDIAYLEDETINQFTSTFKLCFFKKNKDYQPLDEKIDERHLEAYLELFSVFTGDEWYKKKAEELLKQQKEGKVITMCNVVERFMEEGKKEGKAEDVIAFLEDYGEIPKWLEVKIREEHDVEKLKEWLKISARAGSMEEFLKITNLREN